MRRTVVLSLLLAVPAAAAAPVPAPGTIVFTEGASDLVRGPWISLAECQGTAAQVSLSWTTQLDAATSFPADAFYQAYASNQPVAGTQCHTISNATAGLAAGAVGSSIGGEGLDVLGRPYGVADILAAAGAPACSSVSADTPIHVCVQAYAWDGTRIGIAVGTLTLSTSAPAAPAEVSAAPWDSGALQVSWTAPAGTPAAFDYRVVVTADGDPMAHELVATQATSAVVTGLVNDLVYRIRVYARSRAGNESLPAETTGVPVRSAIGVLPLPHAGPGGGCAAGAGGPLALLAVAALLARRRRCAR